MVLAASFGHISGVHFNPSVTIGVLIAGEMQAVMAILYIVMQLLGGKRSTHSESDRDDRIRLGIAAGGLLRLALPNRVYAMCRGGATHLAQYAEYIENNGTGRIVHAADHVHVWQVGQRRLRATVRHRSSLAGNSHRMHCHLRPGDSRPDGCARH